jgi:hypothetical protein
MDINLSTIETACADTVIENVCVSVEIAFLAACRTEYFSGHGGGG